jgi:molybdate transport system substrate-binding protein
MRWNLSATAGLSLFFAFAHALDAEASEITVCAARAIATVLAQVGPQFEKETGHKLKVVSTKNLRFLNKPEAEEAFDVLVSAPPEFIDDLIKDGKLVAETRTPLVRSGIGVEVRAGEPKPDISSVDAFKHALLDAKSIGYLRIASGAYVAGVVDRLGIADAIKSKVTRPETDIVSEMVARGELELGIVVITQILTTPGVELVGPLPSELQFPNDFVDGVSVNSKVPAAAAELIKFLKGSVAVPVIRSQGMEPL